MKKLLVLVCVAMIGLANAFAQTYPIRTLVDIQKVPLDSLKVADSLGVGANSRWTLQTSPRLNDTVTVVVLVTVPPKLITYTAGGRTLAIVDTGANGLLPWSGILVRLSSDSATADADGFFNIERGDIVKMTGQIQEFPTTNMNSLTQFAPIPGKQFEILSSGNKLPPPTPKTLADFNIGPNPNGKVMFSTGEPYEAKEVVFTNLTVGPAVNTFRGTFTISDAFGNTMSDYDWSFHFSLGHGGTELIAGDPNYKVPPAGTKIDTMRGYISTSSGGESTRGYRICPIFVGDIVYGKVAPGITTHRRNPVIVSKDSSPVISAKAFKQTFGAAGGSLATVKLIYSVNNGAWQEIVMTATQVTVDSTYKGTIPAQAAGNTVRYFVKVTDSTNQVTMLANSGSLTLYDTSKGFFFYKSLDRSAQKLLSIRDIQYTPYLNGRSPYVGGGDSVGGIVTADTASLRLSPISTGSAGTNAFYIQSSNTPWSGLWLSDTGSVLLKLGLKNGDSIVVAGTVAENFDVTRLERITSARIVSRNNPLPTPVKMKTDVFGVAAANGNLNAEPYEGMLAQFDSVTLTALSPNFDQPTEYEVNNSSSPILVRRDGRNTYTNDTTAGLIQLKLDTKIKSLMGIIYYNNSRYKVVPRTNADFVGVPLGVKVNREDFLPKQFALDQNYPNPFNPATTIRFSIPTEAKVTLKIYNVLGQEVATLLDNNQSAGTYSVRFDASSLASGMYLYRITAQRVELSTGQFVQVKKMLLVK